MAIKKSELYSSLWKSCDELRGGMDDRPCISGLHTIVTKSKANRLDNLFKRYCFQTRVLKQRMMQELLTGRIRLVKKGGSSERSDC